MIIHILDVLDGKGYHMRHQAGSEPSFGSRKWQIILKKSIFLIRINKKAKIPWRRNVFSPHFTYHAFSENIDPPDTF